jgi:hypothetical protein
VPRPRARHSSSHGLGGCVRLRFGMQWRPVALERRCGASHDSTRSNDPKRTPSSVAGQMRAQAPTSARGFHQRVLPIRSPSPTNLWPMTVPQPDSLRVYLGAVLVLLNRGAMSAGDTSRSANLNLPSGHSIPGGSSGGCVNGVGSSHGNPSVSRSCSPRCQTPTPRPDDSTRSSRRSAGGRGRFRKSVSTVKKSRSRMLAACARRNSAQFASYRLGAGSISASLRIVQTVLAASFTPSPASWPWMRR